MTSSATSDPVRLPVFADVVDAAARLEGWAVRTPLLTSPALDSQLGGRLLIKAEMLQRTGSFKFRGAWNRISRLDDEARRRGVLTYSSGNHGQAVAEAAALLDIPATVVMPEDAPRVKVDGVRDRGAAVVTYDRAHESREDIATEIATRSGATIVPPYDDPFIIAGQGTVGLEIADQATAMDVVPDAALVPVSGGGLIAGCAIALKRRFPDIEVIAVEPRGFDDTGRSLAAGRRLSIRGDAETFCDALRVATPGALTFAVNAGLLAGGVAIADDDTAQAMQMAFRHLKLVAEPAGAIALAAALTGAFDCGGRTVAVVCSGGNVDAPTFAAGLGGIAS